jgi:hypothetical protein
MLVGLEAEPSNGRVLQATLAQLLRTTTVAPHRDYAPDANGMVQDATGTDIEPAWHVTAGRDAPTVIIVEPYRDIAIALEEIVSLARCTPLTIGAVEEPAALLQERPAAIIVRVATDLSYRSPHAGLTRWPAAMRPMVVALVSTDADVAEAERFGCDVILQEPKQVRQLYDTLAHVAAAPRATPSAGPR